MQAVIKIRMNEKLYLRDPEQSVLGKKIVNQGLILINEIGFEEFNFKKLALQIDTTEASIYRYFENKHRLLVYLIAWYWAYTDYKVVFYLNNINDPEIKLKKIITLLVTTTDQYLTSDYIDEKEAFQLVLTEGSKSYLSRHVNEDNKNHLFKSYKDLLCCNPNFRTFF